MIGLENLDKDVTKLKLEIKGGSPLTKVDINKDDVRTKRQGVQGLMKLFNADIKSSVTISIKVAKNLEADTKTHLELMPSTCVVPKKILHFVSGFRN